jgi:hypothetical protein
LKASEEDAVALELVKEDAEQADSEANLARQLLHLRKLMMHLRKKSGLWIIAQFCIPCLHVSLDCLIKFMRGFEISSTPLLVFQMIRSLGCMSNLSCCILRGHDS